MKLKNLLLASMSMIYGNLYAQCLTAPAFPFCSGTETLVVSNDDITSGDQKFYYGTAATLSNVKLSGGTLVICSELTLNDLVFDSGSIFIHEGAKLVVNNAAGLIVRGNSAIYNAGVFQCMGNYVMDGAYASAADPNIFINTRQSAELRMQNQYFVINNAFSRFTNNGIADFHGLITDPLAATGSVCTGAYSMTRMRVLYNRARLPYQAPTGPSCVLVEQYSQFYDTLTHHPSINVCLGNMHTSDASCIPWGCRPNAWGSAQVINSCSSCTSIMTFLTMRFSNFSVNANGNYNELKWQINHNGGGKFFIQRSGDGINFTTIDSIKAAAQYDHSYRDHEWQGSVYYRIMLRKENMEMQSPMIYAKRKTGSTTHPNPFTHYLSVPVQLKGKPVVNVINAGGIKIGNYTLRINGENLEFVFDNIPSGMYLVEIINGNERTTHKVFRR